MSEEGVVLSELWATPLDAVHCDHCREDHLVPGDSIPERCPLCHRSPVDSLATPVSAGGPEQIVPFRVSQTDAARLLTEWARGAWMRPAGLAPEALVERLVRYWIPVWLVDASVSGDWKAEAGYDYQVVSHQDRYREGDGWRSQEVRETRVRWEPRLGRIGSRFDNVAVRGVDDDDSELMKQLGGYQLSEREPYSPEALREAVVRLPGISPQAAWSLAQPAFVDAAEEECRRAAGADHIRDFHLRARYADRHWTHLLVPAYTTWYEESGHIWPVLINGQSSRIHGQRRASAQKANRLSLIIGAIALVLFVLGGAVALLGLAFPPIAALGAVLLVTGVALGVVAPGPAIAAWMRNRDSEPEVPL